MYYLCLSRWNSIIRNLDPVSRWGWSQGTAPASIQGGDDISMQWRKSPQELIDLFGNAMPGPPATQRKMFGYPAGFVNGNMFMGLFQENMILRLPENFRADFMNKYGAKLFEPMPGRPMREYVAVPSSVMANKKELAAWIARAFGYGASLKPKSKTSKPKKAVAKAKPPGSTKKK
jgi:TfoX/Sxy family transcriptional regulator of competence genes